MQTETEQHDHQKQTETEQHDHQKQTETEQHDHQKQTETEQHDHQKQTEFIQHDHQKQTEFIKHQIETFSKENQIEVLKLIRAHSSVRINENKSGVYINLTYLEPHTIEVLLKYIDYVKKQESILTPLEFQKEDFKNHFFIEST
jgi:hypothetical protein